MIYIVSLGMLVAVAAWLVSVYHKLNFLRGQVQDAWLQWSRVTMQRNERLKHFTASFATCLPVGDMLPRDLRRMMEDSRLALSARPCAPKPGGLKFLRETELGLRQRMGDSVLRIENSEAMRSNADLVQGCREVSDALAMQEQIAKAYDRSAGDYNSALLGASARMVSGVFGFAPVAQMHSQALHRTIALRRDAEA